MAIWSFDLTRLTDQHARNIPVSRGEETSSGMPEEGFGNGGDMETVTNFKKSGKGVYAVASTTDSLKALVEYLASPEVEIPVRAIDIGTITPLEIRKVRKMSDGETRQFCTILGFGVDVTPEASRLAERVQVKVICGGELERLSVQFKDHMKELEEEETQRDGGDKAIFPCVLSILRDLVFNKDDPIVLGVLVVEGSVKVGMSICHLRMRSGGYVDLGRIAWIANYHGPVEVASLGERVIIKIVASNPEGQQGQGLLSFAHFDITNDHESILFSRISRASIDALKANHRADLSMGDCMLVSDIKEVLGIK
jgi:translation initiation factor 5B